MATRKQQAASLAQVALAMLEISDPKAPPLAPGRKQTIRKQALAMIEKAESLAPLPEKPTAQQSKEEGG